MPITDDLPDPARLTGDDLKRLRDFFHGVAQTAARAGDEVVADWATTLTGHYARELNARARGRRELQAILNEYRREHPYGVIRFTDDD